MMFVFRTAYAAAAGFAVLCIAVQSEAARMTQPRPQPGVEHDTDPPGGFINFEMRYPNESRDGAPAFSQPADIASARAINDTVNRNITWRETRLWTIAPDEASYGDCKTYALTKRHDLLAEGVPQGAMRLVVVFAMHYRRLHMLLELRGTDGVYVLDSLPNETGDAFYRATAMPASYAVREYQAWGRPEHWFAPNMLTAQSDGSDISY